MLFGRVFARESARARDGVAGERGAGEALYSVLEGKD